MENNQFNYLLKDITHNVKTELKQYLDNYKKNLILKLYGHLNSYLPERFLINLTDINTTTQTAILPNTQFDIYNHDKSKYITTITTKIHDILPVQSIKTSIKNNLLTTNIVLSNDCYLSQDYFSLWLNPNYPDDLMFKLFSQLQNQPLTITLKSNNQEIKQLSYFNNDNHNILPVNTVILDKLFSPNLYNNFRIPLKQICLENNIDYIQSIKIETNLPDLSTLKNTQIEELFTINLISVYNCQRDFSLTTKLDSHHHQITLQPQNLDNDYKLIYPLNVNINNDKIDLNKYDLYLDFDTQQIQYYPTKINDDIKHLHINGLWHKPINPKNYKNIDSNNLDFNTKFKLISNYDYIERKINDCYDDLLSCLNKFAFHRGNRTETICCFLLTGQINILDSSFSYWHNNFEFEQDNIVALVPHNKYKANLLQNIYNNFIQANIYLKD